MIKNRRGENKFKKKDSFTKTIIFQKDTSNDNVQAQQF